MVVFLTRYWDLLLYYVSLYNTCMKIFFITATAFTIFLMKYKRPYCLTYEEVCDDFQHKKFIYPGKNNNKNNSCFNSNYFYPHILYSI